MACGIDVFSNKNRLIKPCEEVQLLANSLIEDIRLARSNELHNREKSSYAVKPNEPFYKSWSAHKVALLHVTK